MDFNELIETGGEENVFDDLQTAHSNFQVHNFILGEENGLTPWSKYKQILRELSKRIRGYKQAIKDIKLKELAIKRLERKLQALERKTQDSSVLEIMDSNLDIDIEETKINLNDEKMNLSLMQRQLNEIVREGEQFTIALNSVKPIVDHLLENGKTKEDLEKEYWLTKFTDDMTNSALATQIGATMGLIRAIRGMEDKNDVKKLLMSGYDIMVQKMIDQASVADSATKLLQRNNQEEK